MIERVSDEIELRKYAAEHPAPVVGLDQEPLADMPPAVSVLSKVDLTQSMEDEEYEDRLQKGQNRLADLQAECFDRDRAAAFVFEGWDAAGKGGVERGENKSDASHAWRVFDTHRCYLVPPEYRPHT